MIILNDHHKIINIRDVLMCVYYYVSSTLEPQQKPKAVCFKLTHTHKIRFTFFSLSMSHVRTLHSMLDMIQSLLKFYEPCVCFVPCALFSCVFPFLLFLSLYYSIFSIFLRERERKKIKPKLYVYFRFIDRFESKNVFLSFGKLLFVCIKYHHNICVFVCVFDVDSIELKIAQMCQTV